MRRERSVWAPLGLLLLGAALGKWADGHCMWLADLTSGIAFWIFSRQLRPLEAGPLSGRR